MWPVEELGGPGAFLYREFTAANTIGLVFRTVWIEGKLEAEAESAVAQVSIRHSRVAVEVIECRVCGRRCIRSSPVSFLHD